MKQNIKKIQSDSTPNIKIIPLNLLHFIHKSQLVTSLVVQHAKLTSSKIVDYFLVVGGIFCIQFWLYGGRRIALGIIGSLSVVCGIAFVTQVDRQVTSRRRLIFSRMCSLDQSKEYFIA